MYAHGLLKDVTTQAGRQAAVMDSGRQRLSAGRNMYVCKGQGHVWSALRGWVALVWAGLWTLDWLGRIDAAIDTVLDYTRLGT